jgi:hypothetical protein
LKLAGKNQLLGGVMASFWLEKSAEGYFWWKLPVGRRQFKSLEEYSPLPRQCSLSKTN